MGKAYFEPRRINGKTFKYHTSTATKTEAKKKAKALRAKGFNVRVVTSSDWGGRGYEVFKRKRTSRKKRTRRRRKK